MSRAWRRVRAVIDWRFLVALVVLMLVSVLCWGFVQRVRQADALIEQSQTSARYVKDLRAYIIDQQQEFAERERLSARRAKDARAEREALQRRLDLILAFLREQGLEAPSEVPPETTGPRATSPRPAARAPRAPARRTPSLSDYLPNLPGVIDDPAAVKPGKAPKGKRADLKPGQMKKGKR